jgi:hypothetical protein
LHSGNTGDLRAEIGRCHREVAEVEQLLRDGHPDIELLCLALHDWSSEIRELENIIKFNIDQLFLADTGAGKGVGGSAGPERTI